MNETIEIPVWWKCGDMIYRRDCLPINHPEHTYNYIKNTLRLIPEHYGIFHPLKDKYDHLSKEELIAKVIDLEEELKNYMIHCS
jgi:hypothetical protein